MDLGGAIAIYVVSVLVGLVVSYLVIRIAVRHGTLDALWNAGLVRDGSLEEEARREPAHRQS